MWLGFVLSLSWSPGGQLTVCADVGHGRYDKTHALHVRAPAWAKVLPLGAIDPSVPIRPMAQFLNQPLRRSAVCRQLPASR